jgi:hypothetical protein
MTKGSNYLLRMQMCLRQDNRAGCVDMGQSDRSTLHNLFLITIVLVLAFHSQVSP